MKKALIVMLSVTLCIAIVCVSLGWEVQSFDDATDRVSSFLTVFNNIGISVIATLDMEGMTGVGALLRNVKYKFSNLGEDVPPYYHNVGQMLTLRRYLLEEFEKAYEIKYGKPIGGYLSMVSLDVPTALALYHYDLARVIFHDDYEAYRRMIEGTGERWGAVYRWKHEREGVKQRYLDILSSCAAHVFLDEEIHNGTTTYVDIFLTYHFTEDN